MLLLLLLLLLLLVLSTATTATKQLLLLLLVLLLLLWVTVININGFPKAYAQAPPPRSADRALPGRGAAQPGPAHFGSDAFRITSIDAPAC